MPDVGLIVGASLMGVGGLSVLYGAIMCYKSPVSQSDSTRTVRPTSARSGTDARCQ